MKQIMSCEQFQSSLDPYLDNELNPMQRAALIEHARVCPECGERLELATRLMTMCAEMDEGVQMPLDGQAAWRKAIRDEAQTARKPVRLPAFVRGLSGLAAAMLLIAGGTFAYQNRGPLSLGTLNSAESTARYEVPAASADRSSGEAKFSPLTFAGPKGVLMVADDAGNMTQGEPEMSDVDAEATMDEAATDQKAVTEFGIVQPQSSFDPSVDKADIKEVRYASRSIETTDFTGDLETVKNLVEEYAGRFDDQSIYGAPIEPGQDRGREAYLSARVPTADLDAFLTSLDAVGTVTAQGESSQEITKQYYDAQTRLASLDQLHQELEAMIPQAQGVSELIEIKRELANVEAETESLNTQLSAWNNDVNYATVSINLSEVADKKAVQAIDSASLAERVNEGFVESINKFGAFTQDMLVFCVTFWPWLVLALIVLIVVCTSVRRRRRNRA